MKQILFIEDESALQKTIGESLRQEDFEVLSALDGEIGIRTAKEKLPDLIILDLVLPKKDGFEVLEDLKKGEETKNIPVVVLTNLEDLKGIQRAIDLGATTYLVKSNYRLDEVVEKIKGVLSS
ncbi:MAG TPA: response regulator [Candidatus Wildermuthbacteria bacterium]|nr:response regulator [Candidatus Wildermuthbacteria bacterium]